MAGLVSALAAWRIGLASKISLFTVWGSQLAHVTQVIMRYINDVDYALEILEMLKPQTFQIESDFDFQAYF